MKVKGFKFFCGECRYQTPLLSESQGLERIQSHYLDRHPGVYPEEFHYAVKVKRGLFG